MSLLGSRLVIGLRLRPALEEAEIDVPQPQPRRQNPAQHRRNNDLNRKAPAPWVNVPATGELHCGQQRGTEAEDKEGSAAGRGPQLRCPSQPGVGRAPEWDGRVGEVCHRRTVHSTDQRCASALPTTASPSSRVSIHPPRGPSFRDSAPRR